MTWDRSKDALIAQIAEGWVVHPKPGLIVQWPSYNTDIVASVRAAEAWRKQKPGVRYWELYVSLEGVAVASLEEWDNGSAEGMGDGDGDGDGDAPAAALATAVYHACGGPK